MHPHLVRRAKGAVPLHAVAQTELENFLGRRTREHAAWIRSTGFSAKSGETLPLPDGGGGIAAHLMGLGKADDTLALAAFAETLPEGTYVLDDVPARLAGTGAALAWLLGIYSFKRYRKSPDRWR
jgi:leucyl aminopeptidase